MTALLLSSVAAAGLPLVLLAGGWLQLRRDFLLLSIYLQGLLYVHVGPYLYARAHASVPLDAYRSFALSAVLLFDAAFLLAYVLALGFRRARVRFRPPEKLELQTRRFNLLVFALAAFALTFWSVAWSAELIYRRLGVNALVVQQLNLPFASFVVYRLYIEGLRYMIAVVVLGLVLGGRRLGWPGAAAALAVLLSAYVYLVINSRIDLALNLLIGLAVWSLFWRGRGRFWPRLAGACAVAVVLLLYSISTTERIRIGFARSWTVDWRAFVPGMGLEKEATAGKEPAAGPAGAAATAAVASQPLLFAAPVEMPMSLRLNGLDLMARMRPALEERGYAWGRAWEVPAALVVLPVVNPRKARAYKLRWDLAAKNYLMREYTAMADLDYVSCMLTDAYGNFGQAGILAVGLFLGVACALAVRVMAAAPRAALVLVALFAVCHLFQFEQEFISALLFWVKKLPLLLGVLLVSPLRVRREAGRPAGASGG